MSKSKKTATATAKSDAAQVTALQAQVAELTAQVAALTVRVNPPKYEASPRQNQYDPTAAFAAPALPDIYDASAIEADLRAIGSFPSVAGQSSGIAGINLVGPKPYPDR